MKEEEIGAVNPESQKSPLMESLDETMKEEFPVEESTMKPGELLKGFEQAGEQLSAFNSQNLAEKYGSQVYEEEAERAGKQQVIGGFNYTYEYMQGDDNILGDDLKERQAQAMPGSDQFKRGLTRLVGEFTLNVLETPGIVGGAVAAAVTGDINKMTDNFWVNASENLKGALHESNKVYSSKHVRDAGVWDKMSSGEWLATEGASALAFMSSALIPGLAVSKAGKAMGLARALAKGGKGSQWALGQVDKASKALGLASKSSTGLGVASAEMGSLVSATLVNTVFESGIEAMGAQHEFEEAAGRRFQSGEITGAQYADIMSKSSEVASNTFRANVAILMGPNMVMSKMMLGPRGNTLSAASKNIHLSEAGQFIKGAKNAGKQATTRLGKVAENSAVQAVGRSAKRFGTNTLREGVWEEGAQSTATSYYSEQYLDALVSGEDSRNWIKTYAQVLGSTDGQIAALTGGILSGPMSMYSSYKQGKDLNLATSNLVNQYNGAGNFYTALRNGHYVTDEQGNTVMEEVDETGKPVTEPGTGRMKPKVDNAKMAEITDAKNSIDSMNAQMQIFLSKGETFKAKAMASRLQAQVFAPFISNGKEGMKALEEMMTESPATAIAVKEYNKENNTEIGVKEYVAQEMIKVEALSNDLQFYRNNLVNPTSFKWDKANNLKRGTPEFAIMEENRSEFHNMQGSNYMEVKAVEREFQEGLKDAKEQLADHQTNDRSAEVIAATKKDIIGIEKDLQETVDKRKEMETYDSVDKEWTIFYNKKDKAARINNEELVYDLDDTISKLKNAKTTEEVEIIVQEGIDKGIILPDVKKEYIPEQVKVLMNSTNLVSFYAGASVFLQHKGITEASKGKYNQILRELEMAAADVLSGVLKASENINNSIVTFNDEIAKIEKEYNDVMESISKVNDSISERSTATGRAKRGKAKEIAALKRSLVKLERLSTSITAKFVSLNTKKNVASKELANVSHVLAAMASTAPNNKIKESIELALKFLHKPAKSDLTVFEEYPMDTAQVIEGFRNARDVAISSAKDLGVVLKDTAELNRIDAELKVFKDIQEKINKAINSLKALIKKASKAGTDITGLQAELTELEEFMVESSFRTEELVNIKESNSVEFNKNVRDAQEIVGTLEAIFLGDYNVGELIEKEESEMSADEYNAMQEEFAKAEVNNYAQEDPEEGNDKDNETKEPAGDTVAEAFNKTFNKLKLNLIAHPKNSNTQLDWLTSNNTVANLRQKLLDLVNTDNLTDDQVDELYLAMKVYPELGDLLIQSNSNLNTRIGKRGIDTAEEKLSNYMAETNVPNEVTDDTVTDNIVNEVDTGYEVTDGIHTILKDLVKKARDKTKGINLKNRINKFMQEAENKGRLWSELKHKGEMVTVGSKIYWTGVNGKELSGDIRTVIKGEGNGTNILVETENGDLHVITGASVRRSSDDIIAENDEINEFERSQQDKEKKVVKSDGKRNMAVFAISDNNPKATESSTKHPTKENVFVRKYNAFLRYLEEARDKSKDIITFGFQKTFVNDEIFSLINISEKTDEQKERLKLLQKLKTTYDSVLKGVELSEEDINLLIDHMPMTLAVKKSDGTKDTPKSYVITKRAGNESFDKVERPVREKIIRGFLEDVNREVGPKGEILNMEGNWAFQHKGLLNVDFEMPKEGNRIDSLKGVTQSNMEVFTVLSKDKGKILLTNGEPEKVPSGVENKVGGVFIRVKDNTGTPSNVRLKVGTLKGSAELDILMEVLSGLVSSKFNMRNKVSAELIKKLETDANGLYNVFAENNFEDLTYGILYSTLLYPGTENSPFKTKYDNSIFSIGADSWNSQTFEVNREAIKEQLGSKYKNINFPNSDMSSKTPDTKNPLYLKYLIETRALSTNLKTNGEALFIEGYKDKMNSPDKKTRINTFISPREVRRKTATTDKLESTIIKEAKKTPAKKGEPMVKLNVKILSIVKKMTTKEGYKSLMNSNKAKAALNSVGKKTKASISEALDSYNNTVTSADKEAGDTKIEKC